VELQPKITVDGTQCFTVIFMFSCAIRHYKEAWILANVGANALISVPQLADPDVRVAVEAELLRILGHSLFSETTRMKRFLKYVVIETLEGRGSRIKGYSLGVEVFDRPSNFNPQADTIVRVQAGQLRRRLDQHYGGEGRSNPVRIVIPKGRYEPRFEMRNDVHVSAVKAIEPLALITEIEKLSRPGVAVLTFDNLTGDAKDSFFAEGITAELVNALVHFRYLRIVARSATVSGHTETTDVKEIGKKYKVQFVLTGNVRRVKNLVRVSVNLISTSDGNHVYSKIFDRECTPENLFEIQEEIASYVAVNVGAPYGVINRHNHRLQLGCTDMRGYEAILQYYEINLSPTENKARELKAEFEEILKDKPRFSSGWAVYSLVQSFIASQCIPCKNQKETLAGAAIAIDPENALAYKALFLAHFHRGEIKLYREAAAKSIALNPFDYSVLAYYAVTLAFLGEYEEALIFQKAALDLVARAPLWFYTSVALAMFEAENFETIEDVIIKTDPDTSSAVQILLAIAVFGLTGRTATAAPLIARLNEREPDFAKFSVQAFLSWNPNPILKEKAMKGWKDAGFL